MSAMKTCKGCGETRPHDAFHKHKQCKDGLNPKCKACRSKAATAHYARPEVKARKAEYYAANYDSIREKAAERYAANRDTIRARQAEYYAENRERLNAQMREYYAKNRDTIRDQVAEYRARPEVKARASKYKAERRAANPHFGWAEGFRWRSGEYGFHHLIESMEAFTKEDVIERYGNKCFHCGGEFEELDHFPVAVAHGGSHTLANVKPACTQCNRKGTGVRTNRKGDNQ